MKETLLMMLVRGMFGSFKLLFKTWFGIVWAFSLLVAWVGIPEITPFGFIQNGASFAELIGYAIMSLAVMIVILSILDRCSNKISNWISD